VKKAVNSGLKFFVSTNYIVILSPGNDDGIIPADYFEKVWQVVKNAIHHDILNVKRNLRFFNISNKNFNNVPCFLIFNLNRNEVWKSEFKFQTFKNIFSRMRGILIWFFLNTLIWRSVWWEMIAKYWFWIFSSQNRIFVRPVGFMIRIPLRITQMLYSSNKIGLKCGFWLFY